MGCHCLNVKTCFCCCVFVSLGTFIGISLYSCIDSDSERLLLLGRKAVTKLDSLFKNRDIALLTKVHVVKAVIIPVVIYELEKAMAPYSSTLGWKIPWMEEPGRLQSMGLLTVRHD